MQEGAAKWGHPKWGFVMGSRTQGIQEILEKTIYMYYIYIVYMYYIYICNMCVYIYIY